MPVSAELGKFVTEAQFHDAVMRAGLLGMVRMWLAISGLDDAESMRTRAVDLLRTLIEASGRDEFVSFIQATDAQTGLKTDLTGLI